MRKDVSLESIEKEIRKLTTEQQLKLVEKVARELRKSGLAMEKKLDWNKLYGLGKRLSSCFSSSCHQKNV